MKAARWTGLLAIVALTAGCNLPGASLPPPPVAAPAATTGGVLSVGITRPAGIDPFNAYEPNGRLVSSLLCDTLVSVDPVTGDLRPDLAAKWLVSPNGTTITLELRHGVRMADGRTLNASDVAWTLSSLASPRTASREAGLMSEVAGYDKLASQLITTGRTQLLGVSIIDTHDLQISLSHKDPGFLYALAEPAAAPLSEASAVADPSAVTADPPCAGPYVLAAPYRADADTLRLVRNPAYRGDDLAMTHDGTGYASFVDVHIYSTVDAADRAFVAGQVDLAPEASAGAPDVPSPQVVSGPDGSEEYIGLPIGLSGPLDVPAVRDALSMALDRTAIVDQVWGDTRGPATSMLPPSFLSSAASTCAEAPISGMPAAARRLLGNTSVGPITFSVDPDFDNVAEADAVAQQWRQVLGLDVSVDVVPWTTYLQTAQAGSGFPGPFRVSWSAQASVPSPSYDDGAEYLSALFPAGGVANWERYDDSRFEYDFDTNVLPAAAGSQTRRQEVTAAAKGLCAQLPLIPLAYGISRWLIRTDLVGTARTATWLSATGYPLLREVYLSSGSGAVAS